MYKSNKIIEAAHFSTRYLEYQRTSAQHLEKIIGHKINTAVEIGAGAGIFLTALNAERRVAIEPSNEAKQISSTIEVFNDYYSSKKFKFPADLIILRQVLEHIKNPKDFLEEVKCSFEGQKNFYLYLEVPNSTLTFRFGRFYDFYYEHCNYFSTTSIIELAAELGMEIIELSTAMDGELLSVLMTTKAKKCRSIAANLNGRRQAILKQLEDMLLSGQRLIAWGASGNGVQIMNDLKINREKIKYVIDSDINKQGKFIPGTLQKIISPAEAVKYNPSVVLVLTQFHKAEP